ncbi:hypothetical protein ZTR_06485 [Talaromyces verruculosus]|nr:hypothetical protein ZTR_06485 [Talaromyces verruculosus]
MTFDTTLSIYNHVGTQLSVIEKCVWYESAGGEWNERDGDHILTIKGGRGSGLLRFKESNGDVFHAVIGFGYNGYWVDVQANLADDETGVKLLPEYYRSGGRFSHESHDEITRPPLAMPFAEGTSVTFPTDSGESTIGPVKGFEGGKIVEVEKAGAKEYLIEINRRDIFDYLK